MDLTNMIPGGAGEGKTPQQQLSKEEYAAMKKQQREEVWAEVDAQAQAVFQNGDSLKGFLDFMAQCNTQKTPNLLLIYGQNPEATVVKSYDYWKAHPRVFFQTPEGMEEYRIAAVLKADVSMFDFQQTSFHSPQELEAYAAQAKALSLFETGVAGAGCETTLTLVTCSYEWKEARNILVAVKAEPER